ncbi:MAG: glycosyltransferase family 4 protein [bacterium]
MKGNLSYPLNVFFISTYPPRRCGIATFTFDLVKALSELYDQVSGQNKVIRVVALSNISQEFHYPPEVVFEINDQEKPDYHQAAHFLNSSESEVVCLQHEFGIFGGRNGIFVLDLLQDLRKPIVTTLHSLGGAPKEHSKEQCDIVRTISQHSTFVVVIAQKALELLRDVYGVPQKKIVMIHHGAPDVPFFNPSEHKAHVQAKGRPVILTFGLINPNKGIETAIEAMGLVAREIPEALYIILGVTHPNVIKRSGEKYRHFLQSLVRKKGLEKNIVFHNKFVSPDELATYLAATDIYVTPYRSKEQISSGTLTQALAYGKAIVSTPYPYARELLKNGRGRLIKFGNPRIMAQQIIDLLKNESERNLLRRKAYQFGRWMIWPKIAREYLALFKRALEK